MIEANTLISDPLVYKGELELIEVSWEFIVLACLISVISIFAILVFVKTLSKKPLMELLLNSNGFPTLAKFQFVLWTLVIAFSYFAIHIIIIIGTDYTDLHGQDVHGIPENLLAMMGISVAVSVIKVSKTEISGEKSFRSIFYNLQGNLDLAQFQMFLWTIIGISIYLYTLFDEIITVSSIYELFLPDISPTLLILMGLSQGAYLGSKLTEEKKRE